MSLSKQIFFRLYLVIIVSIILIGWSFDYLWQSHISENQEHEHFEEVLLLSTKLLEQTPPDKLTELVAKLNASSQHVINILPMKQIQADDLKKLLTSGQIIILENEYLELIAYKQLGNSENLVGISIPVSEDQSNLKYFWLAIFYALIAGVVYVWTRPLNRDLKTLEDATMNFAESRWEAKVNVPANSPISQLAKAYNDLLTRIMQLLNDQQEMSHSISHELRTPLARILFSIEMASNSEELPFIQQQLSSITEDINDIQQLVDELLNYASLEKTTAFAHLEKGDIQGLINTLIEKTQRNFPDKKITYQVTAASNDVYCDSFLIERGLQNLIINALKHCKSEVRVSFIQQHSVNKLLIEDDGLGVPKTERLRIFDSFVRLAQNQPTSQKGFGLGLAIVKRIAQLHCGSAYVTTSNLGGAQFVIDWPNRSTIINAHNQQLT